MARQKSIYLRPATRYVATFIGSPQMDLLDDAIAQDGELAVFRVGAAAFPLPEPIARTIALAARGEPVQLGVRAESVTIGASGEPATVDVCS